MLNRNQTGSLIAVCVSLSALGCAANVEDDAAGSGGYPGENVSTTQEDATLSCWPTTYPVAGSVGGPSTATDICYISEYDPSPTPTNPNIYIFQLSGTWHAAGYGTMSCVPQACFHADGAYQRWLSPDFMARAYVRAGGGSKYTSTPMWLGDAMPILTGIHRYSTGPMGQYDGASTYMYGPTHTSDLTAAASSLSGQPESTVDAFGYSFFVGVPYSGHVVQMQSYYVNQATPKKRMINTGDGICAFSSLSRVTDPATDFAVIYPAKIDQYNYAWYVQVGRQPGIAYVDCFYFNQR